MSFSNISNSAIAMTRYHFAAHLLNDECAAPYFVAQRRCQSRVVANVATDATAAAVVVIV